MSIRDVIAGVTVFAAIFAPRTVAAQGPTAPVPAVIDGSCAPWDGPAFEVRLPLDGSTAAPVLTIAIWQAPQLPTPVVFRFPDSTQQLGAVSLDRHDGTFERLSGTVRFDAVLPDRPVTGSLRLTRERDGTRIERTFRATWGRARPLCGL